MTPPRFLPLSFLRRPSPRAAMHHVGAPCVHSPSVERIIVAATPPPTASATRHPRPRDRLSSWIPFPRRRERCFASPYGEPWRRARIRATTRHTENCQNSTKRFYLSDSGVGREMRLCCLGIRGVTGCDAVWRHEVRVNQIYARGSALGGRMMIHPFFWEECMFLLK